MPNKNLLIELQYLPPIEYFTTLQQYDFVWLEAEEHFEKQTYRNRCYILGANNIEKLIVPVIGGRSKTKIKDIQIDYSQKWLNNHWRSICSAYGKAPFFEFFIDYFESVFYKREKFLFDLNFNLLSVCLNLLGMEVKLKFTENYKKVISSELEDKRSIIHPKSHTIGNSFFQPISYPQVFGKNFVANLSIIDLLFCEGPNARTLVTNSMKKE